jgi:hypothetical protein
MTFNDFNSAIFEDTRYPIKLWNPYSNLVQRDGPMGHLNPASKAACEVTNEIIEYLIKQGAIEPENLTTEKLEKELCEFRVFNAIKLRKVDPLRAKARSICTKHGLGLKRMSMNNILSDIAAQAGVGRFLVYEISDVETKKRVLFNAVAVHDNHGDDKSKEWGARRLATLYRLENGKVEKSEFQEGIFVLDGEWKDKDVIRLHRCGWNHVVRITDLESTLKKVFGITSTTLTVDTSGNDITIEMATGSGVTDVNSLSGSVGLTSGTLTIGNDVGSNSITIEFPGNVVNDVNGLNGSVTIDAGDGISVSAVNQYVTISTTALAGLASPVTGDIGNSTFTITGVSASLTATSVVLSCVQVPDQPGDTNVWLVNSFPSSANGGSITFNFASVITTSSQLLVAYHVAKL